MRGRGAAALLIAGWTLLPLEARACAVCLGWTDGQGLNGGFYWSALLLTALPFVVVGVIGAWVARAAQNARPGRKATTASGVRKARGS